MIVEGGCTCGLLLAFDRNVLAAKGTGRLDLVQFLERFLFCTAQFVKELQLWNWFAQNERRRAVEDCELRGVDRNSFPISQ